MILKLLQREKKLPELCSQYIIQDTSFICKNVNIRLYNL